MKKEEMAAEYAASKMEEVNALLQEAFLKGYAQGELKSATTITIDDVTYADLGLPSGTLWSITPLNSNGKCDYYDKFGHNEACKYSIPTVEQYRELISNTETVLQDHRLTLIGTSSERISLNESGYFFLGEICADGYNYFWLKDDSSTENHAQVMYVEDNKLQSTDLFIGYRLPIFLVKNKADL